MGMEAYSSDAEISLRVLMNKPILLYLSLERQPPNTPFQLTASRARSFGF
jgi:hypothetical protein